MAPPINYTKPTGPPVGRCMMGAINLRQSMEFFDGKVLAFNGCYVPRPPRHGTGWSTHAEGRALDFNAPIPGTDRPNPNPIPNDGPTDICIKKWMWVFVATSQQSNNLGVQRFVYKQTEWIAGRGTRTLSLLSSLYRDHRNHIHIELTKWAAQNLTGEMIADALFPDR